MKAARALLIWAILTGVVTVALGAALTSPLLAWRQPVYIAAGAAGVVGLILILFQPLLAAGLLPGASGYLGRRIHRWTGAALVTAVVVHVGGLWITSPPDVIDALTFTSPTPFSAWGVIAMWAVFATAGIAVLRRRFRYRTWQMAHGTLALVIAGGTVVHALLIEGTMGWTSKVALCVLVLAATGTVIWGLVRRRHRGAAP
ncbi:MAG: ferric reductase-like transmembrane domain-containing protein [Pseudomonadota bacterium]